MFWTHARRFDFDHGWSIIIVVVFVIRRGFTTVCGCGIRGRDAIVVIHQGWNFQAGALVAVQFHHAMRGNEYFLGNARVWKRHDANIGLLEPRTAMVVVAVVIVLGRSKLDRRGLLLHVIELKGKR